MTTTTKPTIISIDLHAEDRPHIAIEPCGTHIDGRMVYPKSINIKMEDDEWVDIDVLINLYNKSRGI